MQPITDGKQDEDCKPFILAEFWGCLRAQRENVVHKAFCCHGRGVTPTVCHAWFRLGSQATESNGMKCEFHQRLYPVLLGTILLLFPVPKNAPSQPASPRAPTPVVFLLLVPHLPSPVLRAVSSGLIPNKLTITSDRNGFMPHLYQLTICFLIGTSHGQKFLDTKERLRPAGLYCIPSFHH